MKKFYQAHLKECRFFVVLFCIFFSLFPSSILLGQTAVPFTTAGATTWFCPAGVTSITVECWGGGGAGGGATGSNSAGGGGAGGAYTKAIIAVTPGTAYNLFVGAGGVGDITAGASGGSSWFNTNTTLLAIGGTGGALASANNSSANGATAPVSGNIGGTTNFYGGNGGKGSGSAGSKGGGGGGSAGSASDGNDAVTSTGGTAVTNGGAGANGSTSSADGADATTLGGGGAGARTSSTTNRNGGNGFTGKVLISYTTPGTYKDAFQSMSIGASNWCAGETRTVTVTVKNTGTAAWVDAARQDINIGVKWDLDPDYLVRTDVVGLAAGATGTYTFTVTAPATAGTNHLTFDVVYEAVSWFAGNGGGVGPGNLVSQSVALTINALPGITTQPSASSQNLCRNATATALSVVASGAGLTYQWYSNTTASNSGGSIIPGATLANYTPSTSTVGTLYYYCIVSGTCAPAVTSNVSGGIIVNAQPTATAGGTQTICQNGTATVSGATSSNGTILWSHNGVGFLSNATTLTPTYTPVAGDAGHTVTLTMTVSNSPCTAATATYTVIVNGLPIATAGGSQSICQGGTATVNGATASNGTILWSHNGGGSLTNATTLTPTYTAAPGDAGNTVTLTITVTSSNACSPATASATYSVVVKAQPTATAGGSQTICQNGTATVSGATSSNGTISWSHNGVGSLSNVTTLTPTYTAAAGDAGHTVTLTMMVSNSPCTAATATYSVIVNPLPTATAGGSQSICQSGTATVSGASASNGTILWTHNGSGSLTNATSLTPTYTVAAGDVGSTVTLTMTVTSNNLCSPATATATYSVVVKAQPTATAGGSQTICQNGTATVSGATSSNGTILWSHNGVGSLSNATTLTPTYTAAAGDAGHTVTLTMTVSNSPCTAATATYSVIVTALPTATAGGSQTICQSGTATVSGATSSNGTIVWTHNGTGSLTNVNTLTPTYTASAGDAGHTVILTMTVSNSPCTNATATYSVIVKGQPTASAGGSQTICQNGTATVSGATSGNGTIAWTENGAGSITSGSTTLTPTYTAAAGDAGNTVTLTMTVSNSPCAFATATYTIFVKAKPTASAGGNQTICQYGTATVSGASSTNGTIVWAHNGAGSLTNATTLTPTYSAVAADAGNTVTLTMTVSNSPCTNATAIYSVFVKAQPTANAGTPVTMCSNSPADISAGATSANNNGTLWTTSGDGTFDDATVLGGTLYAPGPNDIAAGSVTITLTATGNSPCGNATSSKIVTITSAATSFAGTPINTCSGSGAVNITTGATASNYTAVVWTKSGTGTLANANSLTLATYTPSAADIAAGSVTLTLTATGTSPCGNAVSTKILSIASAPTSVIVTPATSLICVGSSVSLSASAVTSSTTNIAAGSDNFNGTPAYVSSGTTNGIFGSSKTWTQENSGFNDFLVSSWTSPDGSKFMLATCADFLFASTNTNLTSPVINTTNYSSLSLSFQHNFKKGASGDGEVQISTDNGVTWTTLRTYSTNQGTSTGFVTDNITGLAAPYINQANLRIRFNFNVSVNFLQTQTSWWAVDNVTLNGTPIPLFSWTALPAGATAGLPVNAGTALVSNKNITVTPTQTTIYTVTATDPTGSCTTSTATSTVTVNQKSVDPTSATASVTTICNGSSTVLTLNGGGGGTGEVIRWYKTSCGGTAVGTGNNLSVSPATTTTYFGRYEDGAPCNYTSACAPVTVTVNQLSVTPTSVTASSTTICNGSSTILTLNGGGTGTGEVIHWYSGSCGGTPEGTGNNLSVSPIITTTYYGRYEDGVPCNFNTICKSIIITVNQKSVDPVSAAASFSTICNGSSTILTLNGGGGGTGEVIHWYKTSCGGTAVGTGNNLSVSPTATTTYYGRYEDGAPCNYMSACASVTITVNQLSATPTSATASSTIICNGASTILTLNGGGGGTGEVIHWYSNSCGGTPEGTGNNLSVSPSVTTTYYGRYEDGAPCNFNTVCKSVTITVNQKSADPVSAISADATICSGSSTTLTLNGGGGGTGEVIHWYSGSCGGTPEGTGNNLSVSPSVTTTYYGRYEDGAPCNYTSACASVTITVNQPAVAGITGNTSICLGSSANIIFTATPNTTVTYTINGSGSNTINVGATGNATLNTGALASTTTYSLVSVAYIAAPGCSQTATGTVTINITSGTWLGFSADWNDPANWCGGLPTSVTDVVIPAGTPHDPVVSTGVAMAHDIAIASGASVTVTAQTMQIAGSIANSGIFDVSNGAIELNGASTQVIPVNAFANNTIKDLIISNDASLGGQDSLTGTLSFGSSNKTLVTNGNLTLKSTISGTAAVGQILNGNNISGDVTVERYIGTGTGSAPNHGKSWQLLAVPTVGQTIKQAWQEGATTVNGNPVPGYGTMLTSNVAGAATQPSPGFDVFTSAGPSIKVYNYATDSYTGPASTQLPIYNKKGYYIFVRGDRSVVSAFAPANPTILRTKGTLFTPSNPPPVDTVIAGKFESVGNPYASAVDLRNIIKTAGVDEFFYVWDPRLGGSSNYGAFQTFFKSGSDYIVTPGGGSYGPFGTVNNFIQSGQAFMVQATGSNGTVSFTENSKAGGSALFSFASPAPQVQKILQTALYSVAADGSKAIVDGVVSSFDETYSNDVDGQDAKKSTNSGENLSIRSHGKLLAIERKQNILSKDTIFLNLTGIRVQSYQFQLNAKNLNTGLEAFLEDKYLQTRTPLNLSGSTVVNFAISNVAASYANDRFRIVFAPQLVLPVTFTSIKAYQKDKSIRVEWKVENEMNVKQYDVEKSMDGTKFTTISVKAATANGGHSANYLATDANPEEGYNYYRVKSMDINGRAEYTDVVKVLVGSIKQEITIYPNPITDGVIHLKLTNQPVGKYDIRLLNKIGQVMISTQVNHTESSSTELIKWDYNLAHGLYQLEVTRPDKTSISINVMY